MNHRSFKRAFATGTALFIVGCNGMLVVEDEPGTESERWLGNAPDCPEHFPDATACSVPEGQICSFSEPDPNNVGYTYQVLCGCFEASSSAREWYCYQGQYTTWECPAVEPLTGEPCFGSYGIECNYPERNVCKCSSSSGLWSCEELGRQNLIDPPPSVPPERPITELSDEERAAWCDWLMTTYNGPGFPEPSAGAIDENGFTQNRACTLAWDAPCLGMMPWITSADCEANLRLSTCQAPISELGDCVLTVTDSCWPSPHGCARYLERPGCSGTVVVSTAGFDSGGADAVNYCKVRVQ